MKLLAKLGAAGVWFLWFLDQPQGFWWVTIYMGLHGGIRRVFVEGNWREGIVWFLAAAGAFAVLKVISYRRGEPMWPRLPVSRDGGQAVGGGEQNSKVAAEFADSAEVSSRR